MTKLKRRIVILLGLSGCLLCITACGVSSVAKSNKTMIDASENASTASSADDKFKIEDTVTKKSWTQTTVYSEDIGDYFVIDVMLPEDYDAKKSYPVVYLTDCYWRREDYNKLRNLYKHENIREFILVGIGYPDDYDFDTIRERDLTNGAKKFLEMIVKNVIPYAEQNYSIDSTDRTFCGASLGGYFMLYSLFQSDGITNGVFKNYVISSPVLQRETNGKTIEEIEEKYHEKNSSLEANVYMSAGALEPEDSMLEPVSDFVNTIESRGYEGLNISYKVYDYVDHYSVWVPTLLDGLRTFYK